MDLEDLELMFYAFQNDFGLAMLGLAVLFGFILAFAVGANDSANSWGTPVGAGTVSFGVAVILGSITETLGAVILSGGVVSGISGSSSIVKIKKYQSLINETEFGRMLMHRTETSSLVLGTWWIWRPKDQKEALRESWKWSDQDL